MTTPPPEQADVEATDVALTVRKPFEQLDEATRTAIVDWLVEHGIDPALVALDAPVERDELFRGITWREDTPGGRVVRHRFPAVTAPWPAPFPRVAGSSHG
jgi:hypothetical protein